MPAQSLAFVFVPRRQRMGIERRMARSLFRDLMKYLLWLLKAVIFFTLFAFALNNQRDVVVHLFFGTQWQAPLVLVVLLAFSVGVIVGIVGMVPRWWKHRKAAQSASTRPAPPESAPPAAEQSDSAFANKAEPLPPHGI